MSEIKELKEKQQKEDNVLLAFAAGNRQPVVPHLEYEFPDMSIHEDLFKLVEYSCEEVCTTKEQLSKVMRLWTTFMEPMLGIVCRSNGKESSEDRKIGHQATNCTTSSTVENGAGPTTMSSKPPKFASNGEENNSLELANSFRPSMANGDNLAKNSLLELDRVSKDDQTCNLFRVEKVHTDADVTNKMCGFNTQVASGQGVTDSKISLVVAAEQNHGRTSICGMAGVFWISSMIISTFP